ncbi:hypothetical protein FF36_05159 [Frankia torreyi]|uniref:Uncharacterized protein n=1 Tax=Frankia torreyi TaxID=1856 RepID=A0A0D8BB07_9ACTN|nr:hypothetical protein FF36_05159 [Frankia torreyi]
MGPEAVTLRVLGAACSTEAAVARGAGIAVVEAGIAVVEGGIANTGAADDVGTADGVAVGVAIVSDAGRIDAVCFLGGSEVAPMMMNKASRTVTAPLVLGWRRHQSQARRKKTTVPPECGSQSNRGGTLRSSLKEVEEKAHRIPSRGKIWCVH